MAATSTPIGGSLRVTYMHNRPNMRVNGVNPLATASQVFEVVQGIRNLQDATVNDAFLISEFELDEE